MFIINSGVVIKNEKPVYRVVLDPGHGGISMDPISKHGDYYDKITGRYLEAYTEGAAYRGVKEHIVVYEIAKKVDDLLKKTQSDRGFLEFLKLIKKYGYKVNQRIIIKSILSRPDSRNHAEIKKKVDPNANFRLFDFVDDKKGAQFGRISKINQFKPHLVVSLHCDLNAPIDNRGISAIICPPYNLLKKGKDFLKNRKMKIDFFRKSPYPELWFIESRRRSSFKWFISDTMLYFTGYKLRNNYRIDKRFFKGYKYNMVSWKYKDDSGWEKLAAKHHANTQYSLSLKDYKEKGKFWERERSIFEKYRRKGGVEGYGGDNCYASQELIRYILTSLKINYKSHSVQRPGHPYVSIWSLPLYVNAVTAFIELGYLRSKKYRFLLTKKQNEIAEGIAVGIYSLYSGIKLKVKYKYAPHGKRIDFGKYKLKNNQSYFDIMSAAKDFNHE